LCRHMREFPFKGVSMSLNFSVGTKVGCSRREAGCEGSFI
jgi:hypothetical protein